jgi:hypothetical protein
LDDLELHVRLVKGTEMEEDVNCDTRFMLESVDMIGKAIRTAMHWIPTTTPITLFIDNAGGHGTNEGKAEYKARLKKYYNVIIQWQIPNSTEMNMLDLGFWATHQAVAKRLHKLKWMDADVLSTSVQHAFELVD